MKRIGHSKNRRNILRQFHNACDIKSKYNTTNTMKKTNLLAITGLIGLMLGASCLSKPSSEQPDTMTSSSSTPAVIVQSSTTFNLLIDRPVSEWPLYEFQELGFEMRLPFRDLEIRGGLEDCAKAESRCDGPHMKSYVSAAMNDQVRVTVVARSPDFSYDGAFSPFASTSLIVSPLGIYKFKSFNFLESFVLGRRTISLYRDGVQFFYEWNEGRPRFITVLIPLKNASFPVAALVFDETNFSYDQIKKIVQTLTFSP